MCGARAAVLLMIFCSVMLCAVAAIQVCGYSSSVPVAKKALIGAQPDHTFCQPIGSQPLRVLVVAAGAMYCPICVMRHRHNMPLLLCRTSTSPSSKQPLRSSM